MTALPDLEECKYENDTRPSPKIEVLNHEIGLQDANDALSISLVSPSNSGLKTISTFHPKFTYPIFGDDEKIFGYKDLKLHLRYRANDMRPHLRVSHTKKFKAVGDAEPLDIVGLLEEGQHLPKGLYWSF